MRDLVLRDMDRQELLDYALRLDPHCRVLASRNFFLEATIARALHEHSSPDRVCVCPRCLILRTPLRQNLPSPESKDVRERSRNGDAAWPDDPVYNVDVENIDDKGAKE